MSPPLAKTSVLQTITKRLRGDLVSGLIVVLPIWATGLIVIAAIGAVETTVRSFVPAASGLEAKFGVIVWLLGLVALAAATTMIGYAAKRAFGRKILGYAEGPLNRFPIVRSIYGALKQLVVTAFDKSDRSFKKTCLIEYPHERKWAVSLIAGEAGAEIPPLTGESDLVAVFMPTTPNPITGFLFYVPAREIVPLAMNIEDAAKLVISAGLIDPPRRSSPGLSDSKSSRGHRRAS